MPTEKETTTMPMERTTEPEVLGTYLTTRREPRDVVLMPVMDVAFARKRLDELQEFCASYLQESQDGGTDGGDYGIIPGAGKKKVLLKSGAEKLCDVYGLADRYRILSKVEDFDHGLFDYTIECELVRKTDEMFVGSGLGSCSTYESKYRWRNATRVCPSCSKESIIKGKEEYGGGWICWKNKGGCGAKFSDADTAITDQKIGRTENPDIMDAKNTVLKMAKKRAKIDAVIGVTRSSGIFTQDLDDVDHDHDHDHRPPVQAVSSAPAASTSQTVHGPVPVGAAKQPGESQADYVARVKAEAAARFTASDPVAPAPAPPQPPPAPVVTPPITPPPVAPPPPAPAPTPAAPVEATPALPALPDGQVYVTAINVRNGPTVVKDGVTKPSWGPLFVIAFSAKVKASDGTMVADASTFDEALAKAAESAHDAKTPMVPKVDPGKKKGSFALVGFGK